MESMTYDSTGRLASESIGGEVTASYTYDAYGNRAQKTEPDRVTKYTYNLSNQLILEDVNGNTTGFGYDGNGNLRSQISGAGETYYIYDLMGRMIQSNVNDTVTDYTYDGDGMRLTKTNGEKTINYINDGMYVSGEVSGESIVKYTYGRSLISIDNNGTMGYYHTDEHGNVRKVTDSKGNTLASYEYDAFGQETGTAVDYYNPMRYCGEYRDEETGLIYLRARYYDSGIGRFISEDPAKDGENWYVYCGNNPVMFVDPSGEDAIVVNQTEAVGGAGHMSAFVEDDEGNWFFFFWGGSVKLVPVNDTSILEDEDKMNDWLRDNNLNKETDPDYDSFCYILGDFSDTKDYYQELESKYENDVASGKEGIICSNKNYNPLARNCTQETMKGLYLGTCASIYGNKTVEELFNERGYTIAVIPNCNLEHLQSMFIKILMEVI